MKITGYLIQVLGLMFLVLATNYFGNNFLPSSSEEIIADGIGMLICAIGLAVGAFAVGKKHNNKEL